MAQIYIFSTVFGTLKKYKNHCVSMFGTLPHFFCNFFSKKIFFNFFIKSVPSVDIQYSLFYYTLLKCANVCKEE